MEGFELIATGLWSIVPPILALVLALITKEVYSSLTIGVFTGMIIYQFTLNGVGGEQLVASFTMVPQMMAEQIAGNGALLLFLALLGALTVVIATAGGSRAYAEWVTTHVKNARAASILTALLGIIIFVDDYFNCLTVGAVMRPVTDKFRVSHEKLAWIIDSTAAPVCIIAPVSSWAVAVGGYMGEDVQHLRGLHPLQLLRAAHHLLRVLHAVPSEGLRPYGRGSGRCRGPHSGGGLGA